MSITVVAAGMLTTVQDLGRHGHAGWGIGAAGAMDPVCLRLANLLVGNAQDAAALEIVLRGPRLRFAADCRIALTGAPIDAHCDGTPVPMWSPFYVPRGAQLSLGNTQHGALAYLAVGGGIATEPVLGSRSIDINAGIGGAALASGDVLSVHGHAARPAAVKWSLDPAPWFDPAAPIRLVAGTHFPRLDTESQHRLFATEFRISSDSNRVGFRLQGEPLALREPLELVSAGVVTGTMQLPPAGAPIVLMAEAPTSGGYPRIAHVIAVDLPSLAQRRPGDRVRFTRISLATAQTRYLERERALSALAQSIQQRLQS
jgi:antagonist of KipI